MQFSHFKEICNFSLNILPLHLFSFQIVYDSYVKPSLPENKTFNNEIDWIVLLISRFNKLLHTKEINVKYIPHHFSPIELSFISQKSIVSLFKMNRKMVRMHIFFHINITTSSSQFYRLIAFIILMISHPKCSIYVFNSFKHQNLSYLFSWTEIPVCYYFTIDLFKVNI